MTFPATTLTAADLAPRLGAGRGAAGAADVAEVDRALDTAVELLTDACAVTFRTIPANVADNLVERVVRALWDTRKAAHGAQFTDTTGEAAPRAPRDPLASCEAILARYVVPL